MVTTSRESELGSCLFGKTRRAVLALLYGHPDEAFYLRQIVRTTGAGLGPVQRELRTLSDVGVVRRTVQGRQVYFQANAKCPVFGELRGLMLKTVGVVDVLRDALAPLANRIEVAMVHGSVARGDENSKSDVDMVVVGDVSFSEAASATGAAEKKLARDVNPTVYSSEEFRTKLRSGNHFLRTVLREPKVFVIGTEDDLTRVG